MSSVNPRYSQKEKWVEEGKCVTNIWQKWENLEEYHVIPTAPIARRGYEDYIEHCKSRASFVLDKIPKIHCIDLSGKCRRSRQCIKAMAASPSLSIQNVI